VNHCVTLSVEYVANRIIRASDTLKPVFCALQIRYLLTVRVWAWFQRPPIGNGLLGIKWSRTQRGRQTRVWGGKIGHFLALNVNISQTVGDTFKVTISD